MLTLEAEKNKFSIYSIDYLIKIYLITSYKFVPHADSGVEYLLLQLTFSDWTHWITILQSVAQISSRIAYSCIVHWTHLYHKRQAQLRRKGEELCFPPALDFFKSLLKHFKYYEYIFVLLMGKFALYFHHLLPLGCSFPLCSPVHLIKERKKKK